MMDIASVGGLVMVVWLLDSVSRKLLPGEIRETIGDFVTHNAHISTRRRGGLSV